MSLGPVLHALNLEGIVRIESSDELATQVHQQAKKFAKENSAFNYRKRPKPIHLNFSNGFKVRPADVLHELGVATTFFTRNPFAETARLWAHARYCGTLDTSPQNLLVLSEDGNDVVHHHKVAQSEQLGIGFALLIAKRVLRHWYPSFEFQVVDVDVALAAGFHKEIGQVRQDHRTKRRPDYFLVGHKIGGGGAVKVVVLECKGTHTTRHFATGQLATASVQVETVEIANRTPTSLMVATHLARSGITAYVLDPPGNDDLWSGGDDALDDLLSNRPDDIRLAPHPPTPEQLAERRQELDDQYVDQETQSALFQDSAIDNKENEEPARLLPDGLPDVFAIPENRQSWLLQVLARSAAASTLLYAGDSATATQYATRKQLGFPPTQAGSDQHEFQPAGQVIQEFNFSTAWSSFTLAGDLSFEGTRHVMSLPGRQLLEIRRGVERSLYAELEEGRIGFYWRKAKNIWERWSRSGATGSTKDVVSVGRDGTALQVRIIDL